MDGAGGKETVAAVRDAGGEARFVRADVSRSEDVQAMVAFATDTFGNLDCAVNNAMVGTAVLPLADIEPAEWERTTAANYTGVFLCMKYQIRAMLAARGGAIVNIGLGNAFAPEPSLSWYLSAKQGVYGLTRAAALDYAARGVRITRSDVNAGAA